MQIDSLMKYFFTRTHAHNFLTAVTLSFLLASCSGDSREAPPRIPCGGGIQFSCPVNMYCDLGSDCGGIDKKGVCAPIPENCEVTESIICGCDNREYQNECIAKTLGITIKNHGSCVRAPTFIE
jgi:hypothetical protein